MQAIGARVLRRCPAGERPPAPRPRPPPKSTPGLLARQEPRARPPRLPEARPRRRPPYRGANPRGMRVSAGGAREYSGIEFSVLSDQFSVFLSWRLELRTENG